MKKFIVLFLFIGMIIGAEAQSLQLLDDHNTVIEDSVLTLYSDPGTAETDCYLHVKNLAGQFVVVKAKKIIVEDLEGTQNMFCWGGMCYPPEVFVSPLADTIEPGTINDSFHGTFQWLGATGSCKVMYVFFNVENENDSIAITVNYTTEHAGINDFNDYVGVFGNPYPNPANSSATVNYEFNDKVTEPMIEVTSVTGVCVDKIPLKGKIGMAVIQTQNLSEGTYFYTLIINHRKVRSGKLLVKH